MWGITRANSGTFNISNIRECHAHAIKSNLFLYANDSCLVFNGKDVIEIEKWIKRTFY